MSEEFNSAEYIQGYIDRARAAQQTFEKLSQEQVDLAVKTVAKTVFDNAEELASLAVEETKMGNVADKTTKNRSKASIIWNNLKGKISRGILERDPVTGITKVAKPMGVVAAITPCTNPIVTPMSNSMFALKCGNAIVISPHHSSIACSTETVRRINAALAKIGMPENLIQVLDVHSRENTRNLCEMADVVVATGGAGMVKAAYSSGRPALGVGAGNVQCIIDEAYDIETAVPKIVTGRGFDYGIICTGEQAVICPAGKYEAVLETFERNHAYVVREEAEIEKIEQALFPDGGKQNPAVIGKSPQVVAEIAGIQIPADTKIIVVKAGQPGRKNLLGREKMTPVLAAYAYTDFKEAVEIARANLELDGKGHSVCIHSDNVEHIEYAALELSVSRFVINQACASSGGGSFFNGLAPTNTLGCGSWGHNSISENLDYKHLMNVSRIAYYMPENDKPTEEELWA